MIEIRPIRDSEAEPFLRLLCDVFGLDFKRAESIFFNEPLFDLERKWALFEDKKIVSIMTTVPLIFGWGRAIGIAGVATLPERRGAGLAAELLLRVLSESKERGEGAALLFAKDERLYKRIGFQVLDEVVRGKVDEGGMPARSAILSFEEVQQEYDRWAHRDPNRLQRDKQRWRYWKWNLRVCSAVEGGYTCVEGSTVRELVADPAPVSWNLGRNIEWVGLASMAKRAGLELADGKSELFLMGYGVSEAPQMFLTDQF